MGSFIDAPKGTAFPAHYRDVVPGLRLRLYDPTEDEIPDWVVSVEVGDRLRALVAWYIAVVPEEMLNRWGVSPTSCLQPPPNRWPTYPCNETP